MFTTYYRANTKPQAYVFVVLTMMFGLLYSLLPHYVVRMASRLDGFQTN